MYAVFQDCKTSVVKKLVEALLANAQRFPVFSSTEGMYCVFFMLFLSFASDNVAQC